MNGVMLVNMPFAGFRQPSLALGLLKASLAPSGMPVRVLDATLPFAEMIGAATYDLVATWRAEDLLGDWVFAPAMPRASSLSADEYEAQVLAGGAPEHDVPFFGKKPLTGKLRVGLLDARLRVGELLDACLAEVSTLDPLLVGFTSMFHQHAASLALAARVKAALPRTFVLFGGANCRGETGVELLRQFGCVDAVATGEGEALLPELVKRLLAEEAPEGVRGLLTSAQVAAANEPGPAGGPADEPASAPPPVDLDTLPAADYADYFARLAGCSLAGTFTPRLPFETSRGCWWGARRRCAFCGQASEGLAFRRKDAGRALAELEHLTGRHPASPLVVTDEIVAPQALRDFFPQLKSRLPHLEVLYLEVRPGLRKEDLRLLAASGVRRLEAGVESLSTSALALMGKGTTALEGVELLKWGRELDVEVVWNYLWGFPGEDPAEYARVAAQVPLLTHLQPPNAVGRVRLDRFSPLFEDPEAFGIAGVRPYLSYGFVYDLPAEALSRLAYYFAFDDPRGAEADRLALPLASGLSRWKREHGESMLAYADDGERTAVFEGRPGFDADEVTVLDGEHRLLHAACDGVRSAAELGAELSARRGAEVGEAEVAALLEPLVEQGLVLREGSSYLSLALPAPAGAQP